MTSLIPLATLAVVIGIAIGVIILIRRKYPVQEHQPDNTDTLLDAIDGVRDQVDSHGQAATLEHAAQFKQGDKISKRTQFLVASHIADGLSAAKAEKMDKE